NGTLAGVEAIAPKDIWAVGYYTSTSTYQTLVEHWDGTAWSVVPSPNGGPGWNLMWRLSASTPRDVWSVGQYLDHDVWRTLAEHYVGQFTDVNHSDYFYQAVQALDCRGAISGYADATFRPSKITTRGQFCKIIVLA